MGNADHAVSEEKARLQQHLQAHHAYFNYSSPSTSQQRPSTGRSNTVPMTDEELDSSPVHNQLSPAAAPSQLIPIHSTLPNHFADDDDYYDDGSASPNPPPYSGPSTPLTAPAQEPQPSSGPSAPSAPSQTHYLPSTKPPPRYPGLPPLDYRLYRHPLFELSSDRTTLRSKAAHLSSNVDALVALIRQQATVPPKPQIHIVGRRNARTDFAIKLNLMSLLVPDGGGGGGEQAGGERRPRQQQQQQQQRMDYLRCVAPGEVAFRGGFKPSDQPAAPGDGGLEAWAARYVADTASVKSFALERVVVNLDVHWLEGQIRALVAGMKYPGSVAVSFPVTHSRVVVHSPDRVNKFFTTVTGFFAGRKRYEVVKAVWPFANRQRTGVEGEEEDEEEEEEEEEGGGRRGDGGRGAELQGEGGGAEPAGRRRRKREKRRCAVQSEEVWWREWREPIRYAIATKRHGWVTNEDKLEAIMEGMPAGVPPVVDWETGSG